MVAKNLCLTVANKTLNSMFNSVHVRLFFTKILDPFASRGESHNQIITIQAMHFHRTTVISRSEPCNLEKLNSYLPLQPCESSLIF